MALSVDIVVGKPEDVFSRDGGPTFQRSGDLRGEGHAVEVLTDAEFIGKISIGRDFDHLAKRQVAGRRGRVVQIESIAHQIRLSASKRRRAKVGIRSKKSISGLPSFKGPIERTDTIETNRRGNDAAVP